MSLSEIIQFEPLAMERVWGGRRLDTVLGKKLPPGAPVGESWELVDREDAQSVVHGGVFSGATLHQLWSAHRAEVFGGVYASHPAKRFPVLIKILDARDRLSVQVHPPANVAPALRGEPKTEMWYFLQCQPGAAIYAGLKRGVARTDFEAAIQQGEVERQLHRLDAVEGRSIFIPSGRLHAIGEGCLIVEVQQNSDTTYRVFDWNRNGLDGKPRDLHIDESLASIDFDDFEPGLDDGADGIVAACEYFLVEKWDLSEASPALDGGRFAFFTVVSGQVDCGGKVFGPGSMFLVPASFAEARLKPLAGPAQVLRTTLPVPRKI